MNKVSSMHIGKTFEMKEGTGGNGATVWVIFTMIGEVCTHSEIFKTQAEANCWMKYGCN